jgi:hypothetical protein
MDSKFPFTNEDEKQMGIIEEETSDEDNSSKDGSGSDDKKKRVHKSPKKKEKYGTNQQEVKDLKVHKEEIMKHNSARDILTEKRNIHPSDREEEEKVGKNLQANSFNDIRDNYDHIRHHRSSSCKSAAASLQFSKQRYLTKRIAKAPFNQLSKRSNYMSTSTSMGRTRIPSFFGLGNRKMSEPSLVNTNRKMESNSKCLSDASWNVTHQESFTKKSMPLKPWVSSNSSLSSEYSGKVGNTSTTTLTSDFTWEIRSCKLQPLTARRKSAFIDVEFPSNRKRGHMRPSGKVTGTLPELIECEEKLEDEYELFSIRHSRINIMKDNNEFGRKGKRYRSLDGHKKGYKIQCDSDVSETLEEDWISGESTKEKEKSLSKISRIFNKIYADHFERPIRMKQIKERNRRHIHTLGDTPINEDSNDGSNKDEKEDIISDTSSSNMSFRKKYVKTFLDKVDKPRNKTLSMSTKYYSQIKDTIEEDVNECPDSALIKSETYEKFKSRHDRWKLFDKVIQEEEKLMSSNKLPYKVRSTSFDNEPIVEEKDEENEVVDPYYHHFPIKHKNTSHRG